MKNAMFTNKIKILTLITCAALYGQNAWSVDIVGFTLATGTNGNATLGVAINYPEMGRTLTPVGLTDTGYSSNGLTGAGWDDNGSDGFTTNAFSTLGYLTTAVVGQIKGSTLGPKYLKTQYSLNGLNWVDVSNHVSFLDDNPEMSVTGAFISFKFRLPAECDNQSLVYVRWIQNGTTSIGGGTVTSTGTISMKGVIVQSELLTAPTSQSSQITLVSFTPTTITLGCTPGSGNRRYIVMNTVNSFTTPIDNFLPSANVTYSGSGEQIVYVGSGTKEVVVVQSSLTTYWFRYYEYNQLDNETRFSSIDASLNKNPKICALPNIHTPTHTFGLIRATLGATIDDVSVDVGQIIDRGIFWETTPGITDNSEFSLHHAKADFGTYTIDTEVARGSNIYYRAFAENQSGVILSSESSFSNVPVFSGTGNWETASLWNVKEVPGANGNATYGSFSDSPIIDGDCTLAASNQVANLTINMDAKLTINTGIIGVGNELKVEGALINNAGISGLLLKSEVDKANGTLIWSAGAPQGTVEMYSLAAKAVNYKWQFFGIPVLSLSLSTDGGDSPVKGSYIRQLVESGSTGTTHWMPLNNESVMTSFTGYEITQNAAKTFTFAGELVHSQFNSVNLNKTEGSKYPGQHLIGNSFTAAIDIKQIIFGSENIDHAVNLFTTGSSLDWSTGGCGVPVTAGTECRGQYVNVPVRNAGVGNLPAEIPSMQAFIVKVNENAAGNTVEIPYDAVTKNTSSQRAPAAQKPCTRINVSGDKSLNSDVMWLISDASCTHSYENGWDGVKFVSEDAAAPQLYAREGSGNYQVNSVDDFNNTNLGFVAGDDKNYTFTFTNQNLELEYPALFLYDSDTNDAIDISSSGTQYRFSAPAKSTNANRFKILTSPDISNGSLLLASDVLKVYSSGNKLFVENCSRSNATFNLFDISGRIITTKTIVANSTTQINSNLKSGIYVSKTTVCDSGLELISKVNLK